MNNFEKPLLRLKEQLGLQTDKEVAEVLGLSVKAFTARKMRDAFPVDKLLALKASKPELMFDADYVLTGRSPERDAKQAQENMMQYLNVGLLAERYFNAAGISEKENIEYRLAVMNAKFAQLDDESRSAVENLIDLLLTKK